MSLYWTCRTTPYLRRVKPFALSLGAAIRASLSRGPFSLALMLKYPLSRKRIEDVRASAMYHVFPLKEVVREALEFHECMTTRRD